MVKILILDPTEQVWMTLFEKQIQQLFPNDTIAMSEISINEILEKSKNVEFQFNLKASIYVNSNRKNINFCCNDIFQVETLI